MAAASCNPFDLVVKALPHVPRHGWTRLAWEQAEKESHLPAGIYRAAFPEGMGQFVESFHAWIDAAMHETLAADPKFESGKVREKIFACVMARLNALLPFRPAVGALVAHQMLPWNAGAALRSLGHAADAMWKAAGDRSIDYNYYTKRTLLAGVYAATLQAWLDDESADQADTRHFLRARIEDVLKIGQKIGRFKKVA